MQYNIEQDARASWNSLHFQVTGWLSTFNKFSHQNNKNKKNEAKHNHNEWQKLTEKKTNTAEVALILCLQAKHNT